MVVVVTKDVIWLPCQPKVISEEGKIVQKQLMLTSLHHSAQVSSQVSNSAGNLISKIRKDGMASKKGIALIPTKSDVSPLSPPNLDPNGQLSPGSISMNDIIIFSPTRKLSDYSPRKSPISFGGNVFFGWMGEECCTSKEGPTERSWKEDTNARAVPSTEEDNNRHSSRERRTSLKAIKTFVREYKEELPFLPSQSKARKSTLGSKIKMVVGELELELEDIEINGENVPQTKSALLHDKALKETKQQLWRMDERDGTCWEPQKLHHHRHQLQLQHQQYNQQQQQQQLRQRLQKYMAKAATGKRHGAFKPNGTQ